MDSLTEANLKALAGARSFERGLGYLDAVAGVEVGDGWVTASVHGAERYEVELTLDGPGVLGGECDCPYGMEGNFCKHLVALGLTVPAQGPACRSSGRRPRTVHRASTRGCPTEREGALARLRADGKGRPQGGWYGGSVLVAALRASQRRKRNLMRLMDEHGL